MVRTSLSIFAAVAIAALFVGCGSSDSNDAAKIDPDDKVVIDDDVDLAYISEIKCTHSFNEDLENAATPINAGNVKQASELMSLLLYPSGIWERPEDLLLSYGMIRLVEDDDPIYRSYCNLGGHMKVEDLGSGSKRLVYDRCFTRFDGRLFLDPDQGKYLYILWDGSVEYLKSESGKYNYKAAVAKNTATLQASARECLYAEGKLAVDDYYIDHGYSFEPGIAKVTDYRLQYGMKVNHPLISEVIVQMKDMDFEMETDGVFKHAMKFSGKVGAALGFDLTGFMDIESINPETGGWITVNGSREFGYDEGSVLLRGAKDSTLKLSFENDGDSIKLTTNSGFSTELWDYDGQYVDQGWEFDSLAH